MDRHHDSIALMALTYLYDDGDIFAVYKPAGMHSVQLPKGGGNSVADELLLTEPELSKVSKQPGDAGLIHRLDESTSGILVGATTRPVWDKLFEALLAGAIHKTYALIVEGEFTETRAITSWLGSPHRGAKKVKVYESEPASWARALKGTTTYTARSYLLGHAATILEAVASPARRHQVRAHAAHLGFPLLGDTLYGSTRTLADMTREPREFFLHALKVNFTHPLTKADIEIVSEIGHELAHNLYADS
jgi:23S rRNA pseudouridine1911/1915/1917 synthase